MEAGPKVERRKETGESRIVDEGLRDSLTKTKQSE
jgi:hypothetical protein